PPRRGRRGAAPRTAPSATGARECPPCDLRRSREEALTRSIGAQQTAVASGVPSGRDPGLTRPLLGGGGGCPPRGADPCGVPEYESEAMPGLPPAGTDHGPPGRPAGAIT